MVLEISVATSKPEGDSFSSPEWTHSIHRVEDFKSLQREAFVFLSPLLSGRQPPALVALPLPSQKGLEKHALPSLDSLTPTQGSGQAVWSIAPRFLVG